MGAILPNSASVMFHTSYESSVEACANADSDTARRSDVIFFSYIPVFNIVLMMQR
jgi:hypothetical protein